MNHFDFGYYGDNFIVTEEAEDGSVISQVVIPLEQIKRLIQSLTKEVKND